MEQGREGRTCHFAAELFHLGFTLLVGEFLVPLSTTLRRGFGSLVFLWRLNVGHLLDEVLGSLYDFAHVVIVRY